MDPGQISHTVMFTLKSISLAFLCSVPCCFLLFPNSLHAQALPRAIVRGHVVDDSTGAPISLANVFVVSSKIGIATDRDGRFELTNIPLGTWEIVASIVGHEPAIKTVRLADSTVVRVIFRLKPRPVQMASVEVEEKDPADWKKQLKKFSDAFFGSTRNASLCRFLNPEVLDFAIEKETGQLSVTAREPLRVENKALGYLFQCVLMYSTVGAGAFQFTAYVGFEGLKATNDSEAKGWESSRRKAYYGSKRHFLESLIRKRSKEEGFTANLMGFSSPREALHRSVGLEVNPDTLVSPGDSPYERRLSFMGYLQVIYFRENVQHISLLELHGPIAVIYTNGLNPLGIWTHGYWSLQRAAEMLPVDYDPE
jgi:hypothetical protein